MKFFKIISKGLIWFYIHILNLWSAGAIFYCSFPAFAGLRAPAAIIYLLAVILFAVVSKKHTRALILSLLGFAAVALWFNAIQPKAGGEYPPELTLPFSDIKGDEVALHNVRNSTYRTPQDFDLRYETRAYKIKDLKTLDVMVNYWGMEAIAHTFLSFGFSDGRYLAVSVEIRPEVGKAYDMLQGFFKQYQLIYIWGDERDLVRLRTNYKKENVYLYRTSLSSVDVRKMFVSMLQATNSIHKKPQFYNTATHSCTNTLGNHIIETKIANIPFWKRKFLTGDVDKRMYKEGLLDTSLPFAELRRRAQIDERAKKSDQGVRFSEEIRTHL
jgi:hypothetical protein